VSTEDNKRLVREFIESINRQDWEHLISLISPDFVRHSSTFGQREVNNRERLLAYVKAEFQTFPDATETINFLVAEGDKVAVHSRCRATQQGPMGPFPASGKVLSADFISVYRIAKGRIVEAWAEWDTLNGLIQLGHMKPPVI
jgi:steroid delta-isomerase-like uncharacterized protein